MITSKHSRQILSLLAVALAMVMAPAVASAAAGNCGRDVIGDWYDNGRVDKLYKLHCYQDAIDQIPPDLLDYGSAKDDILRALAFAKRGQNDPGDTTGQPTTSTPTSTDTTETTETAKTTETTETTDETDGTLTEAAAPGDEDDPSSVPLPLIILGGLAVLLTAAGVAGYIARRRQGGPGSGADPPAAA